MIQASESCDIKELAIALRKHEILMNWTRYADGRYEFSGIEGKFLQLLIDFLDVDVKFLDYSEGGLQSIKKFHIDMIVGMFTIKNLRGYAVSSTTYEMISATFAVLKSVPLSTKFSFLYPFTLNTWLGFIFVLILCPLFGIFLMKKRISYWDLCFEMIGHLFKQCFLLSINCLKFRIFFLFWLFFTMIVSFSYSAVFFSFMVNPLKNPPIRNFQDLSAAVTSGTCKCYVFNIEFINNTLKRSTQEYMQRLAENVKDRFFENDIDFENTLIQGNIILRDHIFLYAKFGMNSEVYISDDKMANTLMTHHLFRKDFCLKKRINTFISRAWSGGLFQKILKDEQIKQYKPTATASSIRPLSFNDISGVIIVFTTGIIISFIAFVMELIVYHFEK